MPPPNVLADQDHANETEMAFKPKIEGVKQSSLVEFKNESGQFYTAWLGGMPEREHTFYYADGKYEFCFYAERHWEGDQYDVVVKDATIYPFHGPSPRIDPEDFECIRRNMATFFAGRWFLVPTESIPSTEKFRSLMLSWRLA
jgi:hypothetical protein